MIGYLSGQYLSESNGLCLIMTHGIGYEVFMPMRQHCQLQQDQAITVYTHLIVREDAHQLFGFLTQQDRDVFRILIKANQVGPKLALMILDTYTFQELYQIISDDRLDLVRRIKGIGPKMGERLLVQLKGYLQDFPVVAQTIQKSGNTDITDALLRLGYKENHIQTVLRDIQTDNTTEAIKEALNKLSQKETV